MRIPAFPGRRLVAGLALTTALTVGMVASASADTSTGTAGVTGGSLASTTPATMTFSATTLDGTNKTPTGTLALGVNDDTGSGAGWKVQVSATQFTDGAKTLAANALSVTGVTSATNGAGTYTNPTNSAPATVALSTTDATVFNAAVDTGMGRFTITPTFTLTVPASTKAGSYASTLTVTLVAAP